MASEEPNMDTQDSRYMGEPPEGVIAGESVPRENEEEDLKKRLEEIRKARARHLDKKVFGEEVTQKLDKEDV